MNRNILIIFIVVLSSCTSKYLAGEYEATMPSKVEQLILKLHGTEGVAAKILLGLNPDSTFTYETCGVITKGTFKVIDDELILEHEEIFKRITTRKLEPTTFERYPFYATALIFKVKERQLIGNFDGVYYHLTKK